MRKHAASVRDREQASFELELPPVGRDGLDQHEEWCRVHLPTGVETIRFHDYGRIYGIPGLYEELFYRRLRCNSPNEVVGLLRRELAAAAVPPPTLRALDVGAGNGMVGEALRDIGVRTVVGVDIAPEAAEAARRDRPSVYRDYLVADLTRLDAGSRRRLRALEPDVLTTVAALGFGDIPARAFAAAWNLLQTPAWVAFNIKEAFLDERYRFGFSLLVRRLLERGRLEARVQHRYQHRLSLAGEPLHYVAIIGTKSGPIPRSWLRDLDEPGP